MRLLNLVQKVPRVHLGINKFSLLAIIGLLTFSQNASFGQPKVTGPNNVKAGDLVRIMVTNIADLNDPKFQCVPENDKWVPVKTFDGQCMIIFSTHEEGVYTFSIAGNKDNKTFSVLQQIIVGNSPQPSPGPLPQPDPQPKGKYTDTLAAPYLVAPDNGSLIKLIAVYQSMATQSKTISNYKQMMDSLAGATKDALGETALRGVRDAVALILQNDLANRGSAQYDTTKTAAIFTELANSLKPLVSK